MFYIINYIMEFQIYDYVENDEKIDNDEDENEDEESPKDKLLEYIIHVFGRTMNDKSVYCRVKNFTPHFYIKLPSSWSVIVAKNNIKIMENWFKSYENKKVWKKWRNGLINMQFVSKKYAIGFTNDKEYNFARLVFNNTIAMKKYRYMIEQNKIFIPRVTVKATQFNTYESNLLSMLRCFHIKKISGCSWVLVEKYEQITFEADKLSYCDIELNVDWKDLIPIEKDSNAPLRIASFDIECTSCDGQFPMARRKSDMIIQIGTTYTKLGQSMPYRQHIVCLDSTDSVDGAVTEWYNDERDLVIAWRKEIIKSDCDILTGYNIFFFDEKYIYDRCNLHLGIKIEISMLSKLKNRECNFRDFKLSSSAMGENLIRYWDTPGRVHVDLMKDVQNTYNLSSYKLDDVASNFIRGKIENINKDYIMNKKEYNYTLKCANVDDIYDNDFIHIEHVKNFVSDYVGKKYYVNSVDKTNKTISFKSDIDINDVEEGSLFWSQAKDDVTAQDIFSLQKGNSHDRSIIAKYCVKDCRLVNVLVNKLEVITKNIEMSNVCFVPFSYLFVRGQGVKLFSLCLKVYREYGYLFPTLSKSNDEDNGYEGAIVFDPIPSVYYEPLVTKDYASLYPSSILQKNMSHETMVLSSDFDDIEGIEYYNAQYKQNDGTIKHVRFAKKEGQLGVVPTILDTLLKERKLVKKQMKTETNQFKYKILDAKQLALKVTANSLYGQLGAPTSAIYMKAIAACTTSTGREMLIFAKKYDEEILPGFINGLKDAYNRNDITMVNRILQMEIKNYESNKIVDKLKDFVMNKMNGIIFNPITRYGDTDSVFTCFKFREQVTEISSKKSLKMLKKIINFAKKLITFFIPDEYLELFNSIFEEYYGDIMLTTLKIPNGPDILINNNCHNIILPIEDRIKQFLKEYMDESYLPWLWTLQDLFNEFRKKFTDSQFDNLIIPKLYSWAEYLIEKINIPSYNINDSINKLKEEIAPIKKDIREEIKKCKLKDVKIIDELTKEIVVLEKKLSILEEKKNNFIECLDYFFKEEIPNVWVEPFWSIDDKMYKTTKLRFWKKGKSLIDKRGLDLSIDLGVISGDTVKTRLPFPHDLEYEKTFWPFLILTKKRYVGNKYEFDNNNFKQDFMGIVLKRRDNSPIVKEICNGIIDSLINYKDPKRAIKFTKKCLKDMFANKFDINYFLTSKTLKLKESYKDWTKIAHIVLSERIGLRDPGNKPQSGDRVSFAVIKIDNKDDTTLQGDIIETPEYIKKNKIPLDYLFYMTNQIMNPSMQFLELVSKDSQDIFNYYIYKQQLEDLNVEQKQLLEYMIENNTTLPKDLDISNNPIIDKSNEIESMKNIIDLLKKQNRKLKNLQKKVIKQQLE